jgi:dUTP pyrophosphatase
MIVEFTKLAPEAVVPMTAYPGDAGWDLHVLEPTWVAVNSGVDVRTGIAVAIPPGYYGRIVGRSSALRKKGLLVVEGIIDAGFRGELFSYAYCPPVTRNVTTNGVQLKAGDSIAQLILCPIPSIEWTEVDELPQSERGTNGFGSSGR